METTASQPDFEAAEVVEAIRTTDRVVIVCNNGLGDSFEVDQDSLEELDYDLLCNSTANMSIITDGEGGAGTDLYDINKLFTFIGEGILLTCVSVFGLVGNVMSIIVLTKAMRSRSTGQCVGAGSSLSSSSSFPNLLRGLATFDALFLLLAIFSFGMPKMSDSYKRNVFVHLMAMFFGLLHTFRVGSVYVTLAVTFERFHAIICPLRHFKRKKYMLPACVFIAVVYNIPKYFELEARTDPVTNRTTVVSTQLRQNQIYMSLYVFWSKFIFIEIIPYVTILIMNIFIFIKITKSARFRKKFQQSSHYNEDADIELEAVGGHGDSDGSDGSSNHHHHHNHLHHTHQHQQQLEPPITSASASAASATSGGSNSPTEQNNRAANSQQRTGSILNRSMVKNGNGSGDDQVSTRSSSSGLRPGRNTLRVLAGIASRPRRTFTKKQIEEHNLGLILIAMSSLFIFCQSFKIIPDMYELIVCNRAGSSGHHCQMDGPVINAILRMSHLLICVNSSANFLIYYARGEKFRQAWIETFGSYWCICCNTKSLNTEGTSFRRNQDTLNCTICEPLNPTTMSTTSTKNSRLHQLSSHSILPPSSEVEAVKEESKESDPSDV